MVNNMKQRNKIVVFLLLSLVMKLDIGYAFEMYIHTGYTNEPSFKEYGFKDSIIIYEQNIYDNNEYRGSITSQHINKIVSVVKKGSSNIVILDIEYWLRGWRRKSYFEKYRIINRYVKTMTDLHTKLPGVKLGYYGVIPVWSHWDIIDSDKIFEKWQIENDLRIPIADAVDIIYPNLYTYSSDPEKWRLRSIQAINKAREISNGKKIIVFLWPEYHQSSKEYKKGGRALPSSYWRYQLEFVRKNADGVVIWNGAFGNKGDWNEDMPWWVETKKFIRKYFK